MAVTNLAPVVARTSKEIALQRAFETAINVGIVGAFVSTLAAAVAALTACVPPRDPLPPGVVVILGCSIGLRMLGLSFITAAGSGLVNYFTALVAANKNIETTGTTAPVLTAAAPVTPGGIIAPK